MILSSCHLSLDQQNAEKYLLFDYVLQLYCIHSGSWL